MKVKVEDSGRSVKGRRREVGERMVGPERIIGKTCGYEGLDQWRGARAPS